ncbi:MAG TPA: S26 family signal peptidase [Bacteroidetes bacterium]|nr:S26 family signal peptidase [Bacteroidota bacterium]
MKDLIRNKYVRFGIAGILYLLWVIWVGNYWLLPGLLIVFDIYVTKKVNWAFWKKRGKPASTLVEWIDALIFAVIAVTFINIFFFQNYKIPTGSMEKSLLIGDHLFVSKLSYGPKIPNTPLSFPFTQHTMPLLKTKSYLEWIRWDYHRLKGFRDVRRDDVVVFNFPAGDTVVVEQQAQSYYSIMRSYKEEFRNQDRRAGQPLRSDSYYEKLSRDFVWNNFTITVRPVDRRDNYIKRCVALPGDVLEVKAGEIFVNGEPQKPIPGKQFRYRVKTNGTPINPRSLERLGIYRDDVMIDMNNHYILPLTSENLEKIRAYRNVLSVEKILKKPGEYAYYVFPHDTAYTWNEDYFGPLQIPSKGQTVELNLHTLPLYRRIIEAYEGHDLQVNNGTILIDGEPADRYTFEMDYYFMIGDNRHDSADSRFWGFVPEDHVVGSPVFIWLSLNKDKKFPANIRWNRLFKAANR